MLGTYASFLLALGVSATVGQAVFALAGRRSWSWLAPAVGMAVAPAVAWATVRLPGEGTASLVALALLSIAAGAFLRGRLEPCRNAFVIGVGIALGAAAASSLPFIVEGRFGILGTGLNPDMSQHLFAVDRLADGAGERLVDQGYPLGPHALVAALAELGPSTVEAFDGLTLAIAATASLAALALLGEGLGWRRYAGALAVGFAYLVAASLVQGAFKETAQALFVLAFAIALHQLALESRTQAAAPRALRALPLAALAVGSVYVYSFPGLAWLAGALGLWAAIELILAARRGTLEQALRLARRAAPAAVVSIAVAVAAIAPEAGRMASFADFETFDPDGPGLGNLFNRLSPLEALGVWPSGDFRVEPGDGAAPAVAFYLGSALGLAALGFGVVWWLRRGDRAVPAALAAAAVLWLYSLTGGTPYQEAKALTLAAPLVALVSVRALLESAPSLAEARRILARRSPTLLMPGRARRAKFSLAVGLLAVAFVGAAGASSLLALLNGPVGPSGYSPELAELRDQLPRGSTVLLPPGALLEDQHGRDYLVWELRGNRICVVDAGSDPGPPTSSIAATLSITWDDDGAVVPEDVFHLNRDVEHPGPCPFIPDGARADPAGDG
ncbi:MAG: hypothetical protein ACRDK9_00360 [Solirubrobacterales bacterium]